MRLFSISEVHTYYDPRIHRSTMNKYFILYKFISRSLTEYRAEITPVYSQFR